MSYNKEEVKENLSLEDVYTLLDFFGAEPQVYSDYIVSKTICHGGDSYKLYYYDNTNLFKCYTGSCGSFDIFELILRIKKVEDLNAAVNFIVNFFNLQTQLEELDETDTFFDWRYFDRRHKIDSIDISKKKNKIELNRYEESNFNYFPQPLIIDWQNEGIKKEICDFMGIRYDSVNGNILIPHYDEDNNLVGIRQRTLVQENEKYGKYRPWKSGKKIYNHPLAFNLYGLNIAKQNIQERQIAVVVESEKAVMQYLSYFGTANDICVAVCGSSLSKYQFNLLRDLDVRELVIAFDKDFKELQSEDYYKTIKKLEKIYHKYGSYINLSFVFDKDNTLLGYKDSPLDKGRDIFLKLFRQRIFL